VLGASIMEKDYFDAALAEWTFGLTLKDLRAVGQ
jgi:hypothetical protein